MLSLFRAFSAPEAWILSPPPVTQQASFQTCLCGSAVPRRVSLSLSHLSPLPPQNSNWRFVFSCYGEAGDGGIVLPPVFVATQRCSCFYLSIQRFVSSSYLDFLQKVLKWQLSYEANLSPLIAALHFSSQLSLFQS